MQRNSRQMWVFCNIYSMWTTIYNFKYSIFFCVCAKNLGRKRFEIAFEWIWSSTGWRCIWTIVMWNFTLVHRSKTYAQRTITRFGQYSNCKFEEWVKYSINFNDYFLIFYRHFLIQLKRNSLFVFVDKHHMPSVLVVHNFCGKFLNEILEKLHR